VYGYLMEYMLCEGFLRNSKKFNELVTARLQEGWELRGGLRACPCAPGGQIVLMQAMLRTSAAAPDWEELFDHATQKTWYRNKVTGESTYTRPEK